MNFEKTQEQLDTLRNLTWQNGKLIEQNQQLLDQLENGAGAIGSEIMVGKQSLVSAIEYKGGTSSAEKSLQGIAKDIREIPNYDQYIRLASVMAGLPATDQLTGQELNRHAGNLTTIIDNLGLFLTFKKDAFYFWNLIEQLEFPMAQLTGGSSIERTFSQCPNLRILRLKNTKNTGVYFLSDSNNIELIELGILESFTSLYNGEKNKLRSIIIGQDSNCNLDLSLWKAKNVINEGQSGIDELNSNLRTNLLEKLYDHSTDGQTRTLRLGWLAHVTQENIDYANSKGWTLTT